MTRSAQAESRARALRHAREQHERVTREREQLVPEPRHEADPDPGEDHAGHPDTGDTGLTATPHGTDRQAVTAVHCPTSYRVLDRRPRLRGDARCKQCRRPRSRKTKREQIDYVTGDAWTQ